MAMRPGALADPVCVLSIDRRELQNAFDHGHEGRGAGHARMTLRGAIFASGIRRLGDAGAGFRYEHVDGTAVAEADVQRIVALRIPPAWTDVAIARSARGKVQAVGRDAAGRWQYLYLRAHSERRSRAKYDRLIAFGEALPGLRRALERDLRRPGFPLERVSACAIALLSTCFLRPGSQVYANVNGSFGLSTLRKRHVTVEGSTIRFDYRGKHGKRQQHEVKSRRLSALVRAMMARPGHEVFKYEDGRGAMRDLSRVQINAYIKRAMGARFSARDFRTWAGTLLCAGALSRAAAAESVHAATHPQRKKSTGRTRMKKAMAGAVRETSVWLGNTPAMSRRSYIHPAVLHAFERGDVVRHALQRPEVLIASGRAGLDRSEWELLLLLRRATTRRGTPAARKPEPQRIAAGAEPGAQAA
jgi:DNA topoisomerase-1